jgi:succinate dehydrogenase hydrophobic anchor subunit
MKFWSWFFQRVTGAALLLLVTAHVYLAYFASPGSAITYAVVENRINSSILVVDLLLLYMALFHGLYGLRNVITDLAPKLQGKTLTGALTVFGLGLSFYGTQTLTAML